MQDNTADRLAELIARLPTALDLAMAQPYRVCKLRHAIALLDEIDYTLHEVLDHLIDPDYVMRAYKPPEITALPNNLWIEHRKLTKKFLAGTLTPDEHRKLASIMDFADRVYHENARNQ